MTRTARRIAVTLAFLICFCGGGWMWGFKPENLPYILLLSLIPVCGILSFDYRLKMSASEYEYAEYSERRR